MQPDDLLSVANERTVSRKEEWLELLQVVNKQYNAAVLIYKLYTQYHHSVVLSTGRASDL